MAILEAAALSVYVLVLFLGTFLTVFGLPGTVLIVVGATTAAVATRGEHMTIGVLLVLLAMAVVAEAIDFGFRILGVRQLPISGWSVAAAVVGSLLGFSLASKALLGPGAFIGIAGGGTAGMLVWYAVAIRQIPPYRRMSAGALAASTAVALVKGGITAVMSFAALAAVYS